MFTNEMVTSANAGPPTAGWSAWARWPTLVVVLALSACADPTAVPPAIDAGSDTPPPPPLEWPELVVGATVDPDDPTRAGPDAAPADLSCLGTWDYEPPGPATPLRLSFALDVSMTPVGEAVCVRPYLDDVVGPPSPCASTDLLVDAAGSIEVSPLGDAPFALRVFPSAGASPDTTNDDTIAELLVGLTASAYRAIGPDAAISVFTRATTTAIPALLGRGAARDSAIVAVVLTDCDGGGIFGARLRVARADGTYVLEGSARTDPATFYFPGAGSFDPDQTWTHISGVAGMLNVPVPADGSPLFVEAWGRPAGESEPRVVGCSLLPVEPDTLSAAYMVPLRASGPRCPGLL